MSTRCNVVVKDAHALLWFYRHSDGYPSATGESLKEFLKWVIENRIRDNVCQAAGWLIVMGHDEYAKGNTRPCIPAVSPDMISWKVGAYEPSVCCRPDVEFVYVLDLKAKELRCYLPVYKDSPQGDWQDATFDPLEPPEPFHVVTAKNIDDAIPEPPEED